MLVERDCTWRSLDPVSCMNHSSTQDCHHRRKESKKEEALRSSKLVPWGTGLLPLFLILALLLAACGAPAPAPQAPAEEPAAEAPAAEAEAPAEEADAEATEAPAEEAADPYVTIYGEQLPEDALPYDEQI